MRRSSIRPSAERGRRAHFGAWSIVRTKKKRIAVRVLELGATQPALARFLAPLREHEGVERERARDRLDSNAGFLTQPNGGELEVIAVTPYGPRT